MLRVKICGVTRPDDARLAAELGADAIGMVFYSGSPRCVTATQAAEITRALPPWVARVGVFVDADISDVRATVMQAGLTAVQLHGAESAEYIRALALNLPIIKAMTVTPGWQERLTEFEGLPILLDHAREGEPGGTGEPWDWTAFDQAHRPGYFILAGGLSPDNVATAVAQLSPDAIDVSSGIESAPGCKDVAKMTALFHQVRPFRTLHDEQG